MTAQEQREAARRFYNTWKDKTDEKQHAQSFWRALLSDVFGVENVDTYIEFERRVTVDGQTKFIDGYIPETRVLIEQKSGNKDLNKPELQSGGAMLTPFQQAKRYANNMPLNQMPRYIVTCNFHEFHVHDQNKPGEDPEVITLDNLPNEYPRLEFLVAQKHVSISQEMQLSIKAGELVGKIHDRFLTQYNDPLAKHTQRSLNILCVRLVFCLYAEDAGLFGAKDAFERYIAQYEPKDIRMALINLFQVLDTPLDQRADLYLPDDLAAFPYVNGGLFAEENIVIPRITQDIKDALVESSRFDWAKISPTIFGAVFESTLNPETRRAGGMHYTSIENIHKVIDPLFLDDLRTELAAIADIAVPRVQKQKLNAFQDKIAGLKFLDPACGSGNFLTETYLSLRRLENEVLRLRIAADRREVTGQITFGFEEATPIKVSIGQFYGIEINDFACTVAKTALWIAESQMLQETEDIVHSPIEFLPLRSYANIVEGNALRIDWNRVVNRDELSYIMGNPPFAGSKFMTSEQREDILNIYCDTKNAGTLDYVTGWFNKAACYISESKIRVAFVSTNSITQGEQVTPTWKILFERFKIKIDFARRTFKWGNEAAKNALVYCVIIGFSHCSVNLSEKRIYDGDSITVVNNINAYLMDAADVFIESRKVPLCKAPRIGIGNKPIDGGYSLFKEDEKNKFLQKEPRAAKYFMPWYGAEEFLYNKKRYCLYLADCPPDELRRMPECMQVLNKIKEYRLKSTSAGTRKLAETPAKFHVTNIPQDTYILIPEATIATRRYIPMGFMTPDKLCSNLVKIVPNSTMYHFGVLTSNVHMAWTRATCGYYGPSYRYSKDIVYNNFPWPTPTEEQRQQIEQTAQGILDARALYPDASLADLYDPLTMPPELRKAHQRNDAAVMKAYGFSVKDMSEADCVAALMRMYQDLVEKQMCTKSKGE